MNISEYLDYKLEKESKYTYASEDKDVCKKFFEIEFLHYENDINGIPVVYFNINLLGEKRFLYSRGTTLCHIFDIDGERKFAITQELMTKYSDKSTLLFSLNIGTIEDRTNNITMNLYANPKKNGDNSLKEIPCLIFDSNFKYRGYSYQEDNYLLIINRYNDNSLTKLRKKICKVISSESLLLRRVIRGITNNYLKFVARLF